MALNVPPGGPLVEVAWSRSHGMAVGEGAGASAIRVATTALEPINEVADRAPGFVWRLQTEDGDGTHLVERAIADDSNVRRSVPNTVPSSLAVVNNNLYSYAFALCLGTDDYFEGARLSYQYTSAGD